MPRYTTKQIEEALRQAQGMTYVAARLLGCSPTTIKTRLKRSAKLREVREEARGQMTDQAELRLYDAIQRGEPWAIQFYLRTQAKDRGYGDQLKIDLRSWVRRVAEAEGLDYDEVLAEAERIIEKAQG